MQNRTVHFSDLGEQPYASAWEYQEALLQGIVRQKVDNRKLSSEEQLLTDNYLLFCQHPHVYTLGKSGKIDHLLLNPAQLEALNIAFFPTNRGGDITYHGPGQVVGYPILDLDNFFTDIHRYMRTLEEVIIRTLAYFGLSAGRLEGATGVWLDAHHAYRARKICAMGVRCSRWITMHGFALNVNADLSYFGHIIPCGIMDKAVTSLHQELNVSEVDESIVKAQLKYHFANLFEAELTDMPREKQSV